MVYFSRNGRNESLEINGILDENGVTDIILNLISSFGRVWNAFLEVIIKNNTFAKIIYETSSLFFFFFCYIILK